MNNILKVHHLSKNYQSFSLKNVSFELPEGYIMGFIGPNGAGKTTTIKAILNMLHYDSGDIHILGINNQKNTAKINDNLGVVMDSPFYVDDWRVSDVETAVAPFYSAWDHDTFESRIKQFSIDKTKKVKELSRGMKVKLMMSVALSHNAKLLILDEPTSGLDPVARDELCDILSDFVTDEKKSVLFSSHITADLEKIADYITFIMNGKIIFSGLKEELLEKYMMVKGGLNDITDEQKKMLIGLREHSTGFEGMIEYPNVHQLPSQLMKEPVSLEEIIIFMNSEVNAHV